MAPKRSESALAENLAANLLRVREQRGLTQQGLAKLAGIPRSTIANVETGASNPTLAVLSRLSAALQNSLEELLSPPLARCQHFPRGSLPIIRKGRKKGTIIHKLLPHPIPGMEIDRIELGAGDRLGGVPHRSGTQEYLYCEQGAITLWVSGERIDLESGDVATFAGDQAHSYANGGQRPAVGFSVVSLAPIKAWVS
jgi:transcriptional regulator with XRE-family HTH domain